MNAKQKHKELYRKLRVTIKSINTDEYFNTVSEYRAFSNIWEVPYFRGKPSYKNEYKPYRKLSIILRQWSTLDSFEF